MSDVLSFTKSFKGEIVTPSDPGYEAAIARWSQNATRRAKVVAFVKDANDVSATLKYAKAAGLHVAIRSGGHNPAAASSSDGGIVIDLSKFLNGVTVNAGERLAYIGGGALWKTVDEEAIKYGLATVGGTVNHTGVGGLTVGGGYGFLTGLHGLTIDNLEEATVVIADGSILKASANENPDLFWGIRGGGSNFGVVTEFVLRLHPQPRNVFAGVVAYSPDKLEVIATALDVWWAQIKPQEAIHATFTRGPGRNPVVILNMVYHGPEAEGRQNFKSFFDIGPVLDLAKEVPYEVVNTLQNHLLHHGFNFFLKGTLLPGKPSDGFKRSTFDKVVELSASVDFDIIMVLELVSQAKVNSVPADATPYRRNLPGNGIIIVRWENDTPEKSKTARDIAHTLAALTPKGEAYGNYAGPDSDGLTRDGAVPGDRSQIFFSSAYPKLQVLKKKYDPEIVFNKWYPITPAA